MSEVRTTPVTGVREQDPCEVRMARVSHADGRVKHGADVHGVRGTREKLAHVVRASLAAVAVATGDGRSREVLGEAEKGIEMALLRPWDNP